MPEITLPLDVGRPVGSRPAGRLRAEGKIPGIVYGHGLSPVAVTVEGRALRAALTTEAGFNALMAVKLNGDDHLVMARDVQREPVRNRVIHVDFQIVRRDEVMSVEVPVSLVGEADALHREDGIVAQELFTLTVQATPGNIPNVIEVDISELTVGATIRVGDLQLPPGASTDVDPEAAVVVGSAQAAAEAAAEPAEGEEAAAAPEGEGGESAAADSAPTESSEE